MHIDRIHTNEGFSLVEAMVATAILATALLALAQLLAMTVTANGVAGRATYATTLAAQKLETLHATTWEGLDENVGTISELLDRAGGVVDGISSPAVYVRQSTISALAADPLNTRVIEVSVRVGSVERRLVSTRTRTIP